MTTLVLPVTLVAGANENVNDLNSNLNAITSWANGSVDNTNLANAGVTGDKIGTTLAQQLGITNAANTGRGKTVTATTESRTNVAYGTLTTADQVTGIVLPTDGLIVIGYQATWQNSVANAGRAAIFIGATQLQWWVAGSGMLSQEINGPTPTAADHLIQSDGLGLNASQAATYTGDVTTGMILGQSGTTQITGAGGGPVYVWAAAGTYTISVQFKSASGSVTVKNRRLWVWTIGF